MSETRRRVGHSTQLIDDAERDGAVWTVYDKYEIVGEPGDLHVEGRGAQHSYRPLTEHPDLFAKFAGLEVSEDEGGQAEAALRWARKYGVLGLEPIPAPRRKPSGGWLLTSSGASGDLIESFRQGYRRRDSVGAFTREAEIAGGVLDLYKAAMDPTGRSDRKWKVGGEWRRIRNREVIERLTDTWMPWTPYPRDETDPESWREHGLTACAESTQIYVSRWGRPAIFHRPDGRFQRGWGFENLLGAMWLQMYWMLTAREDEIQCLNSRCPNGNPVLPLRDKHDVGRPQKYCSLTCNNHAAQIRRRAKARKSG